MLGNISLVARLFLRELKNQKLRMALTTIAIIWGTLSITMLLAFGNGLTTQLDKNRRGLGDGIMIIWGGQTEKPYKGLPRGRSIWFRDDVIGYIQNQIPQLEAVGGESTRWGAEYTYKGKSVSKPINGLYPEYEYMRSMFPEKGGRFINQIDMDERRRVIFLGNELKDNLFGDEDPIGKVITVRRIPFTVVGVMQKKQQMGSYQGPDADRAMIPFTTFQAMFGSDYLNNLVLKPKRASDNKFVEERLYQILSTKYQFDPEDKRALSTWDVIEDSRVFNNVMFGMEIFFGVIGGLTLLVAGVGVANIMYVAVRERTAEIGVKMAMGARRGQVMAQFLMESLMIAGLGGGLGMLISFALAWTICAIPMQSEAMQWLGKPKISMPIALITIAVLGMIGIVAGYFPARRAASVNPVESLRYE